MNTTKTIAALFDFDGVIMDTETQYTVFWDEQGRKYLNEEDFGRRIKGQTLLQIYEKYFADKPEAQLEISAELNVYEKKMSYEYIPGVEAFITDLRRNGAKIAVVTSSNEEKMANVYNAHPEFKGMVDRILTGEMFARSKPAPDCFLLGMEIFEATPENSYVFPRPTSRHDFRGNRDRTCHHQLTRSHHRKSPLYNRRLHRHDIRKNDLFP